MEKTTVAIQPSTQAVSEQCVTGWSSWINQDTPSSGTGDVEQMTPDQLTQLCPGGTITNIECQTVDGIEYFSSGEIVTCTVDQGFSCNNDDNFPIPCSDYQIRYECTCGEFLFMHFR